jgi:hypothetical protein
MQPADVEHFVEHFDHHDPALGQDPQNVFRELRENHPVAWSDKWGGFWVVSRFEDVKYVLRHDQLFTVEQSVTIPANMAPRPLLPQEVDGDLHRRYRTLLNPIFAPDRVRRLEDRIRRICLDTIESVIGQQGCDFISVFADPIPVMVFTEMMGLPFKDAHLFHAWKTVIMHGFHADPDAQGQEVAGREVQEYLGAVIQARKSDPRDDIVSALLEVPPGGSPLSDDEILDISFLLFLAGLDTVSAAMGIFMAFLAQHPEHRDELVADRELIPSAIEELMRYESVVSSVRTALSDVELSGVTIRKGDKVLCNDLAANRDPGAFPNPEEVVFGRHPNNHLFFSAGRHRCVGSHLARLELVVLFEELHRCMPSYRLKPGTKIVRHMTATAGLEPPLAIVWDETSTP